MILAYKNIIMLTWSLWLNEMEEELEIITATPNPPWRVQTLTALIFFSNSKTGWSYCNFIPISRRRNRWWWLHSQSCWQLENNVLMGRNRWEEFFSTDLISWAVRRNLNDLIVLLRKSRSALRGRSHQRPCSFLKSCPAMCWVKKKKSH